MTPEVTPGLTVPEAGLLPPPSHGAHPKKVAKRKSSEAERSVAPRGAGRAASVVDVFTEMGNNGRARAGREARVENTSAANRADRLQVRLTVLEAEVGRLQQRGRQLDHHLSRVLTQGSLLTSTIDDFHLRLDALARCHKALTRAAQHNHKPGDGKSQ
ncbi:uncharacterized protein LOC126983080 [Eriocheir sinensis]|uniref:uncharacterized protein LOC126983080 n=1 Tax=Eriocheir sinensis TaxID=95602 RepID=UPI0021C8F19B|nr:uncharacterized protein LOC126983080 [Eriocheir sinensis]XP_050691523.1 uncharacterized protein LOC126983080 [Eriocheir sinensis]XP_050691524.1 uncharacterized protein LOC126983080 [Eriocheir sinensis]